MSLEGFVTWKDRKGTKGQTKNNATTKIFSSKSLSLHTISQTTQAVQTQAP